MYIGKKYFFIFMVFVVISSGYLFGAASEEVLAGRSLEQVESRPVGKLPDYYALDAYRARKGVRHIPLNILIDQDKQDNNGGAVARQLGNSLSLGFFPIICTRWTLYQLFQLMGKLQFNEELLELKNISKGVDELMRFPTSINIDQWQLYDIPNSQFLLFMPRAYADLYSQGFNIEKFILFPDELTGDAHALPDFLKMEFNDLIKLDTALLESIFKTNFEPVKGVPEQAMVAVEEVAAQASMKPDYVWDILIMGHGNDKNATGGLPFAQMHQMLQFFNEKLPVNSVLLVSCMSGGEVLNMFEQGKYMDAHFFRNPDYVLIINAITDVPVPAPAYLARHYFEGAARIDKKDKNRDTINNFLRTINNFEVTASDVHGVISLPQVWLPDTYGFKTWNVSNEVQEIGKVVVAKTKLNVESPSERNFGEPTVMNRDESEVTVVAPNEKMIGQVVQKREQDVIEIKDKRAVLLYTSDVPPLRVFPRQDSPDQAAGRVKIDGPIDPLLFYLGRYERVGYFGSVWPTFLTAHERAYVLRNNRQLSSIRKIALQEPNYLYPEFISMIRGDAIHYIPKIEVINELNGHVLPLSGVMNFIRDAFTDISGRLSKKTFIIDEIVGNNDIMAMLKLAGLQGENVDSLVANLSKQLPEGRIVLNKVLVRTYDGKFVEISAIVNGVACWFTGPIKGLSISDLEPINTEEHSEIYEKLKQSIDVYSPAPNVQ